ncbi:MAG: N-acetylmuramoyl-L-alanine amidase [Acetobacter sp.]|nr:N-acetylmuramoyl-L-alanine amidase [Acetobacter sp.]
MQRPPVITHTIPLPHCRERTEPVKFIIIHCSLGTPEKQLKTLDELGLSTHYIIGKDGTITSIIPPTKVAYHAGLSRWNNSEGTSLNGSSIGIELETQTLGQSPDDFPLALRKSLKSILQDLVIKYKIRKENILGHSDVSPTRKPDPGKCFPWRELYKHNFNVWYNLHCLSKETDEVKLLQTIGYDTSDLPAARYAFCRHYMPEEVFVESDIQKLLDNPYPKDFSPKNQYLYHRILRGVAYKYTETRQQRVWFLEK